MFVVKLKEVWVMGFRLPDGKSCSLQGQEAAQLVVKTSNSGSTVCKKSLSTPCGFSYKMVKFTTLYLSSY